MPVLPEKRGARRVHSLGDDVCIFHASLAMRLARRFEADGWCMHPIFPEANADWQLDTKVLAYHVADKLAFAVVLSDSWQISQLLDGVKGDCPHEISEKLQE